MFSFVDVDPMLFIFFDYSVRSMGLLLLFTFLFAAASYSYVIDNRTNGSSHSRRAGTQAVSVPSLARNASNTNDMFIRSGNGAQQNATSKTSDLRHRSNISEFCTDEERNQLKVVLNEVGRWSRLACRASSRNRLNDFDHNRLRHYFSYRSTAFDPQFLPPPSEPLTESRREYVYLRYNSLDREARVGEGLALVECRPNIFTCLEKPTMTMYTSVHFNKISIVSGLGYIFRPSKAADLGQSVLSSGACRSSLKHTTCLGNCLNVEPPSVDTRGLQQRILYTILAITKSLHGVSQWKVTHAWRLIFTFFGDMALRYAS